MIPQAIVRAGYRKRLLRPTSPATSRP